MELRTVIITMFVGGIIRTIINRLDLLDEISGNEDADLLVHEIYGSVGKENYTYYSLYEEGPIRLILKSTTGDADLYVSSNKKPQFDPQHYDYSSTTCGTDVVNIPQDMQRPVIIGVYGHPAHEKSHFTMLMYFDLQPTSYIKKGVKKGLSFKEKLNFIMRNTAMWKTLEMMEGIFFLL